MYCLQGVFAMSHPIIHSWHIGLISRPQEKWELILGTLSPVKVFAPVLLVAEAVGSQEPDFLTQSFCLAIGLKVVWFVILRYGIFLHLQKPETGHHGL